MSRWTASVFTFLGALLLLGTPLAWAVLQPPAQVGQVPTAPSELEVAAEADMSEAEQAAEGAGTARAETADGGPPDEMAHQPDTRARHDAGDDRGGRRLLAGDPGAADAESTDADPGTTTTSGISLRGAIDAAIRPARISIPQIDVDSAIVPVGLEPDGTMAIPRDVATIGWYARGVVPGEPGSAVVTGHVDSRSQGPGAFFGLSTLDVDDRVVLTSADGIDQEWRVVARERRERADIPHELVYARSGPPRLVLITCGGAFDRTARSYAENVIVYAEPVDGS